MNPIQYLINLIQDPRAAIAGWITTLGAGWVYAPLFLIIFIETGVVVMPFLPGDSLLFAAGVFAADGGGLSLLPLLVTVWCAAVLGDQCNFAIGHFFGRRIVASGKIKALTPERIAKTEALLDKYGPLAIFLGRFIPFLRTFVPFFAGIGGMHWRHFVVWNVLGGVTWSSLFTLLGYFFGGVPFVQEHFEWVIILIILISVIPVVAGSLKAAIGRKRGKGTDGEDGDAQAAAAGVGAGVAAAAAAGQGAAAGEGAKAFEKTGLGGAAGTAAGAPVVPVMPSVRDLWELNADDGEDEIEAADESGEPAGEEASGEPAGEGADGELASEGAGSELAGEDGREGEGAGGTGEPASESVGGEPAGEDGREGAAKPASEDAGNEGADGVVGEDAARVASHASSDDAVDADDLDDAPRVGKHFAS